MHDMSSSMTKSRPLAAFPMIRHLSARLTPLLVRLPVTPNQVTAVSILLGLAAVGCFAVGSWPAALAGAVLFVVSYVLDNCDGEVARIKGLSSRFGMLLDTFGDWLVHTLLFAGMGVGVWRQTGEMIWVWLGVAAGVGSSINGAIGLWREMHHAEPAAESDTSPDYTAMPQPWKDRVLFAFRELSRADFCFIVLALALFDVLWFLVPAGAIGAQVYWITAFVKGVDRFHV